MLSILIPTYNRSALELVKELLNQAERLSMPFEIIVAEDGSSEEYVKANALLGSLAGVRYVIRENNVGRSAIRNFLAMEAQSEYLLFLDCDSAIPNTSFLDTYASHIGKDQVVYGGTSYISQYHTAETRLHYQFGIEREALSAEKRAQNPGLNFKTNNFLIQRALLMRWPFDETIKEYGYEDVVFAENLCQNGVTIVHIHNPVIHEGLDSNVSFLTKTAESVRNLTKLVREGKIKETRLTKVYSMLRPMFFALDGLFRFLKLPEMVYEGLKRGKGGNLLFSMWKLMLYHQEQKSLPKIR
ncbi:MAG: glycosyltransferase family 2 protein [Saprospiraceae bacterium]|nr:glycosyltransferase family 2 protein [Saprospiraceae bacterium]